MLTKPQWLPANSQPVAVALCSSPPGQSRPRFIPTHSPSYPLFVSQVHPASLHSPGGGPPLVSALRLLARRATVPIVVHMDHMAPDDWPSALSCLADSAMGDGSHLPYEANVAATRAAVEGCRARGVDVEGELGRIAGTEDGMTVDEMEACMTDPAQAAAFALATGCAALAVCVGNAHGPYPPGGARIDLQRLVSICAAVDGVAGKGTGLCEMPGHLRGRAALGGSVSYRLQRRCMDAEVR